MRQKKYFGALEFNAYFWNRPPEEIHADLTRRDSFVPGSKTLAALRQASQKVRRIAQLIESLPEAERPLVRLLSLGDAERWPRMSAAEREVLLDAGLLFELTQSGPEFLTDEGAQRRLANLWEAIHRGETMEERLQAKRRWEDIFTQALPDLRGRKDRPALMTLLAEYEQALAQVRRIQAQRLKSEEAYLSRLKEVFPNARQKPLAELAEALALGYGTQKRDSLHAIVASPHGLSGPTLRELLAEARRRRRLNARIEAGRERYQAWLATHSRQTPST